MSIKDWPSNLDEEIALIRKGIRAEVERATKKFIDERIEDILGRVKIITMNGMNGEYSWFIETKRKDE